MKIKLKGLNSHGFSHHLIIPVIAVTAIAGIGAYVLTRSKAATVTTTTNGPITLTEYDQTNRVSSIYKVDVASGAKTLLQQISHPYPVDQLSWSPRGDMYAYSNQEGIYVSGAADSAGHKVLSSPTTMPCPNGRKDDYSSPTFSPDGTQIAFITEYNVATDCSRTFTKISKMNVDGTNKVDVAMTGPDWFNNYPFSWSANGSFYFAGPEGLYSVSSGGGSATLVASNSALGQYNLQRFAFSPDGTRFVTERAISLDKTEIFTANIDGTNQQAVTQIAYMGSSNENFALAFAPDGKSVAFRGKTDTLPYGLYTATIPAAGASSVVKHVADSPALFSVVAWQPIVTTTTTISSLTLTTNASWILSGGAVKTTDQSKSVIKIEGVSAQAKASTKQMPKLDAFVKDNFNRQVRMCITARNTSATPLRVTYNSFIKDTPMSRSLYFTSSYGRQCTTVTLLDGAQYRTAMSTNTQPGFTLSSPSTSTSSSVPRNFIEKIELYRL